MWELTGNLTLERDDEQSTELWTLCNILNNSNINDYNIRIGKRQMDNTGGQSTPRPSVRSPRQAVVVSNTQLF